jgi:ribosomal protein S7
MKISTITRRYDILNLRNIVTGNNPKTYEIIQAREFTDRISNELLYIANHKALDCLLGNRCFCFL